MVEKRGVFLKVTQSDLSDEAMEKRREKMHANLIRRKEELEAWLKSKGVISPKKQEEKKNG